MASENRVIALSMDFDGCAAGVIDFTVKRLTQAVQLVKDRFVEILLKQLASLPSVSEPCSSSGEVLPSSLLEFDMESYLQQQREHFIELIQQMIEAHLQPLAGMPKLQSAIRDFLNPQAIFEPLNAFLMLAFRRIWTEKFLIRLTEQETRKQYSLIENSSELSIQQLIKNFISNPERHTLWQAVKLAAQEHFAALLKGNGIEPTDVLVFSNRQYHKMDRENAMRHHNGSCFEEISYFAQTVDARFHPFLLVDLEYGFKPGSQMRETDPEQQMILTIEDPAKVKLALAQLHYMVSQTTASRDFYVTDDRKDILFMLHYILSHNSRMIPNNSRVHLRVCDGFCITKVYPPIEGTGQAIKYELLQKVIAGFYGKYANVMDSFEKIQSRLVSSDAHLSGIDFSSNSMSAVVSVDHQLRNLKFTYLQDLNNLNRMRAITEQYRVMYTMLLEGADLLKSRRQHLVFDLIKGLARYSDDMFGGKAALQFTDEMQLLHLLKWQSVLNQFPDEQWKEQATMVRELIASFGLGVPFSVVNILSRIENLRSHLALTQQATFDSYQLSQEEGASLLKEFIDAVMLYTKGALKSSDVALLREQLPKGERSPMERLSPPPAPVVSSSYPGNRFHFPYLFPRRSSRADRADSIVRSASHTGSFVIGKKPSR
jgi:hypothetical protein